MSNKTIIYAVLIFSCLIFNYDIMAITAPIITINVNNKQAFPFIFIYDNKNNNVCYYQSSNIIKCKINKKNVLGFVLNLSWVNKDNINCGANLLLYGDSTHYLFQYSSTYNGASFFPMQWDGHSNMEANLVIGTGKCNAHK